MKFPFGSNRVLGRGGSAGLRIGDFSLPIRQSIDWPKTTKTIEAARTARAKRPCWAPLFNAIHILVPSGFFKE